MARLALTCVAAVALAAPGVARAGDRPDGVPRRPVATYSIVALDGETGQMGVAVQSHWFSVGSVVPWAEAGVGAIATQSLVDPRYGYMGIAMLDAGTSASVTMSKILASDTGREYRQVAMIDSQGGLAQHTGTLCIAEASQVSGASDDGTVWACQSNMMSSTGVPEAMSKAFEETDDDLAGRLLAALKAAQGVGGDIRGMQSAAILVVGPEKTEPVWAGRLVDLRIEDHPAPVAEMERLLNLHRAYEHMNSGDVAMEHADTEGALREYGAAMQLAPDNTEMVFWTAVSLASAERVDEAMPLFEKVFRAEDGDNWKELLRRLPASDLFPDDPALMARVLDE
jgi:uncharacterized Ntn-hydrolase superfamily protein